MQDDVISFKQGSSSFFMPFLWKISLLTTMLSDGWFNHFATTKPPERLSGCWAFSSRRWFIWGCWTMRWNAWKLPHFLPSHSNPGPRLFPIASPNPFVIIFHETCTRHLTHIWRTQGAISGGHSQFGQQGRELHLYATLPETSPWKSSAAWNTPPGKAGFRIFLRPSKFWGWFFLSYCTVS